MNNGVNFNYANNRDGLVSTNVFELNVLYFFKIGILYLLMARRPPTYLC